MTTIVLTDDHHIVRHGLRTLLEKEPDFKILGEASTGTEALKLVEQTKPNILVCDLMIGGTNGFEVTRLTGSRSPETAVIILSMYGDESYVIEALRSGARGYVLKTAPIGELVFAIREVAGGHRYLSASLSEKAIDFYTKKAKVTENDKLSVREREILQLVAQGLTSEKIAETWNISPRTVETHRAHLRRKLGLHSQKALKYYAFEHGMLPDSDAEKSTESASKAETPAKKTSRRIRH